MSDWNEAKFDAIRKRMTREQWILATVLNSTIMAINAPFCGEDDAHNDPEYIENIAAMVAKNCSSMKLDDFKQVLDRAIAISEEMK